MEQAVVRHRVGAPSAASFHEVDQRTQVAVRAESSTPVSAVEQTKTEHVAVEVDRALEIADLQAHRPEAQRLGQSEAARRLAVAAWRRYLHPAAIAEQIV